MPNIVSPQEILVYAKNNNWLSLSNTEGNILSIFLTPSGNILEVYFEKNKATVKTIPGWVSK